MVAKKMLGVGGALVLILIGLLIGYVVSLPPAIEKATATNEMDRLKSDLGDYVAAKLKEEKKDAVLLGVSVLSPVTGADGVVQFPYTVSFQVPVDGHPTVASVQATAFLKKVADAWRVVKVMTEKENVTFTDGDTITREKQADD